MSSSTPDQDRVPPNWREHISRYSPESAANFRRILRKLQAVGCMSNDECERAAYVIVEKDHCLKSGFVYEDED